MRLRILLYFAAMMLVTLSLAWGHAEWARGEAGDKDAPGAREALSRALESLTVTVELPRSSPRLEGLPKAGIEAASAAAVVRLTVPVSSDRFANLPVAEAGEEPITLGALWRALRPAEDGEGEETAAAAAARAREPMKVLDRLVTTRLIVGEAREIGLDRLPDVRNLVEVFTRRTLRENLLQRHIREIDADPAEVEKLYREAVREWRIKALIFKEEQDAEVFRAAVLAGSGFGEAGGRYVAEGKAASEGGEEGVFLRSGDVFPAIAETVGGLEAGAVTPVIAIGDGFAVVELMEIRFPESEEARAEARLRARNFAQNTALAEYSRALTEKYVKLDKELFEALDFGGSVENFQQLLQDDRVVAEVEGEEPLRVSGLARGIREKFYHGIGRAIEKGETNRRKIPVLNEILFKRVFLKEALVQGIDRTTEFRAALEDYESSVVFGVFIEKVLKPEITIAPGDLQAYYRQHMERYTYSEMVKLRSLVFTNEPDARSALERLRKGTDYRWIRANAKGQAEAGADGVTRFGEGFVTVGSLPEAVRRALAGTGEGKFVLYKQGERFFHVLNLEKRVPSRVQPLEEVQRSVLQDVYRNKVDEVLRDWTEKLREAYGVKVYAKEFGGSILHESP
jgi:parvulin-like peptidyl-prolyl isomerase